MLVKLTDRIKAADGTPFEKLWVYSWQEYVLDPLTGIPVQADPGRVGTYTASGPYFSFPAVEANNRVVPKGTFCYIKAIVLRGQMAAEFTITNQTMIVKVMTSYPKIGPYWKAQKRVWNVDSQIWEDAGVCLYLDANK